MNKYKIIGCYFLLPLMLLSAFFKIFRFGPAETFYAYPLPELMLTIIPYIEIIGGILFFLGAKKNKYRAFGGIVLIPLLFGAVASHIGFGWLHLFNGVNEDKILALPSFLTLCLVVWISYKPIIKLLKSKK
ncbi:hypothetical protein [Aureivirga sp. CE67]|uniref:hypothetical protein n=1 Tax=Aureivirga sp. CE67 TaxID=1788983 RepID=UPI0018CA5CAD|nr:hypothetical protein [Aureivirga sp. CE67]